MLPETRYAKNGDTNIAYQVVGHGPRDLVVVPGWVSNIDVFWEEPSFARLLTRLASFSRLIIFDKRGTGLSDRGSHMPSLEVRMDDVRAVMDAAGSQQAALFGYSEGGALCALFAATYPARASALIMGAGFARRTHGAPTTLGAVGAGRSHRVFRVGGARLGRPRGDRGAVAEPCMADDRGAVNGGRAGCAPVRARRLQRRCCA